MATHTISGNVVGGNGEIVYIRAIGDYPQPAPFSTVTDSNGNYTFSGLADNTTYQIVTAKAPNVIQQVIVAGSDFANVNFAS